MTSLRGSAVVGDVYDPENGMPGERPYKSCFKSVCACFYIVALLIFIFLYGKYSVQELHVIDDVIKVVLNKTFINVT